MYKFLKILFEAWLLEYFQLDRLHFWYVFTVWMFELTNPSVLLSTKCNNCKMYYVIELTVPCTMGALNKKPWQVPYLSIVIDNTFGHGIGYQGDW